MLVHNRAKSIRQKNTLSPAAQLGDWLVTTFSDEFTEAFGEYLTGKHKPLGPRFVEAKTLYDKLKSQGNQAKTVFPLQ